MKCSTYQIKCRLCNSIDIYRYDVSIYDRNDNQVYHGVTDEKGYIVFEPPYQGIYKVIIKADKNICPRFLCTNIFIYDDDSHSKVIPFVFQKIEKNCLLSITIKLTDKNYANLPIEKGEIRLWQRNI